MKYRKKPVIVEAFQLTDDPEYESPPWFTRAVADGRVWIDRSLRDGHISVLRLYDPDAEKAGCTPNWGITSSRV